MGSVEITSCMKVTVLYTPQCPSNLFFVKGIEEVAAPYDADVEIINVHEEHEKGRTLMEGSGVGVIRNLFIRVYLDGELFPIHPGNPRFEELLAGALEARR